MTITIDNQYKYSASVSLISIDKIDGFPNHPFAVKDDDDFNNLVGSIKEVGIQTPVQVRKKDNGRYELISGHRRKAAAQNAGLICVPAIVVDISDEDAVIAMVDSNIQREKILPSEKAKAYKMRLDAMKKKAGRPKKETEFDTKAHLLLDNPENNTPEIDSEGYYEDVDDCYGYISIEPENGESEPTDDDKCVSEENLTEDIPASAGDKDRVQTSGEELAEMMGIGKDQLYRYIRLNYLNRTLLGMTDRGEIAFQTAVNISFLTPDEQDLLCNVIADTEKYPSLAQAKRLKELSEKHNLSLVTLEAVMTPENKGEEKNRKIKIDNDEVWKYIPQEYTDKEIEKLVLNLVKAWHEGRVVPENPCDE